VDVCEAASVPAGTLAVTERLRREGAIAPAPPHARAPVHDPDVGDRKLGRPYGLRGFNTLEG